MRRKSVCICILIFSVLFCLPAAAAPYRSYTYDSYGNAVTIPDVYEPALILNGQDMGVQTMGTPTDLFVSQSGDIYILDSGPGRILVLDGNYKAKSIIDHFTLNGEDSPITDASGLFVDNQNRIFVADTGNRRVIRTGTDGVITAVIDKPESAYFNESVEFLPEKLVIDRAGNLYVKCRNIYQGAVLFDKELGFEGFFGSEKVVTTAKALSDFFWKQFMTEEQKDAMADYVPTEITNFDIADDGFIFSISPGQNIPWQNMKTEMDGIRRLNPKATDTTVNKMSKSAYQSMAQDARRLNFIDLTYDENGFLNIIDDQKGRIYHFDRNLQLIAAFGSLGDYDGTFLGPVAIDMCGEDLLVLDSKKATVTVFRLTDMGRAVHQAVGFYNQGNYEEAIEPWQRVLEHNPNYELAYIGIGSALYNRQEHQSAMEYFLKGRDSERYSDAYKEYRIISMRSNFVYIFAGLIAVFAAMMLVRYILRKRRRGIVLTSGLQSRDISRYKLAFYTVLHPGGGFDELHYRRKNSLRMSILYFAALVLMGAFEQQFIGPQINMRDPNSVNLTGVFFSRLIILFLFVLSNWALSALADGKATFIDIWIITLYSLQPYIYCGFLRVLVSNFIIKEEAAYLQFIMIVGILWSLTMLLSGIMIFHEYELGKTILSLIITLIGMLLIIFLVFLLYSLFQQLTSTIMTLMNEISFRVRMG